MTQRPLLVQCHHAVGVDAGHEGGGASTAAHVPFDAVAHLHQDDVLASGHVDQPRCAVAHHQTVAHAARAVGAKHARKRTRKVAAGVQVQGGFVHRQRRRTTRVDVDARTVVLKAKGIAQTQYRVAHIAVAIGDGAGHCDQIGCAKGQGIVGIDCVGMSDGKNLIQRHIAGLRIHTQGERHRAVRVTHMSFDPTRGGILDQHNG